MGVVERLDDFVTEKAGNDEASADDHSARPLSI
jgi:hypothetical protein